MPAVWQLQEHAMADGPILTVQQLLSSKVKNTVISIPGRKGHRAVKPVSLHGMRNKVWRQLKNHANTTSAVISSYVLSHLFVPAKDSNTQNQVTAALQINSIQSRPPVTPSSNILQMKWVPRQKNTVRSNRSKDHARITIITFLCPSKKFVMSNKRESNTHLEM